MKIKKVMSLAVASAMVLSMAACGDSAANKKAESAASSAVSEVAEAASSAASEAEEAASSAASEAEEAASSAASEAEEAASSAASEAEEAASSAASEAEEAASSAASEAEETTAAADDGTALNVCIASEPATLDPALNSSVDGATMTAHLFSGLAKWAQTEDGALEIVPDAAEELVEGVENEDGTVTYTYTLRDGLKWSDGKDVTAKDFEFAWNRAASPELAADYGYMFEVVDGYEAMWEMVEAGETEETATSSESEAEETAASSKSEAEETASSAESEAEETASSAESEAEETASSSKSEAEETASSAESEAEETASSSKSEAEETASSAESEAEETASSAASEAEETASSAASEAEEEEPEMVYANPDATLNVHAIDDKTLEVTLVNRVAYWNELLAFPSYFPVREDVVENDSWATDPSTYVGNGAYTMTGWDHSSVITLTKNENYVDADQVTMPVINFYLSDDANNMLTNFENGEWKFIDDMPTNEMASLKDKYPDEFVVAGQLGTYYVIWNVNEEILPSDTELKGDEAEKAKAEIRNAVSLLFDRNYICDEIGQAGQVPASSFVAMGLTDAGGEGEFYENAGHSDDYIGYYDVSADALESNFETAIEVLKKYYEYDEKTGMFKNFPTMTYLYNTSDAHKAIGEYLQSALAGVGITMNLENQEWNTFLETRKNGDYSIARNGWLGDYNDPISFLDMWTTGSGNNDAQFGRDAHKKAAIYSLDLTDLGYDDVKVENGTWAETYDVLITLIKTCTDEETRYALMHRAEDLLMSTGAICPLYYYTDPYMLDSSVKGFFANPLGYKYFMYTTIEE